MGVYRQNVLGSVLVYHMPDPHELRASTNRSDSAASTVFFGKFELNIRTAELHKNGRKIRLQEQPFQILAELLEHPGEVVLRDELRKKLWPNNTVVEFDHSINAAVKRLRIALADSAEKPRFVETIARRGYRFIAPISREQEKTSQQRNAARASVAVLPFVNISGDLENEYFSDGLSEEVINELAHVPGLKVIARTSAFAFKGKREDIRDIGRALGVANIVEGSVRKTGGRIRITAQLISATDGTHLWGESYDRHLADIFAVQDEIAQAIATALRVHLAVPTRQYIPRLPAYEKFLRARYCLAAFTHESLHSSREFYEQAIKLDADFALAQSGMAMTLISLVLTGISSAHISMPLARAAARRALDIDPVSQEANAVLGMVAALYDFDWSEAERLFSLAMIRQPVPSYVRWYYSFAYLLPQGRIRESERECQRGLEDDPLNFIGEFHYAAALLAGGKADAGETQLRGLSELHSFLYQPYYLLALSRTVRGLQKEALVAADRAYLLAPWSTTTRGLLAGLLSSIGEVDRAEELRHELLRGDEYGAAMGLLLFHLGCSETRKAAEWGERAIEQRDPRMILLMSLVRVFLPEILRSDPSWSGIARMLGIPSRILAD